MIYEPASKIIRLLSPNYKYFSYTGKGDESIPVYWKDGQVNILDRGNYKNGLGSYMNDDGSVIAGHLSDPNLSDQPVYWKNGVLHILPWTGSYYNLLGISGDGRTIIGDNGGKAIIWKDGVNIDLGQPVGSSTQLTSYDGSVLSGRTYSHPVSKAWVIKNGIYEEIPDIFGAILRTYH